MKAFLSHSSKDKEFVRNVANKLGRQNCIFDEQCFEEGKDFKSSIEHHLDKSSVFILFATTSSMKSVWVSFESDEAWYRKLNKKISSSIVYIIDNELSREEIPEWLKRALIKKENSPSIIAKDIQYVLDKQSYERQEKLFIGRSNDIGKLEDIVNPYDGTPAPRIITLSGLPGIGRKTLLKRSSDSLFNLNKHWEIRIESADTIHDICCKIADLAEPYSSRDELKDIITQIQSSPIEVVNQRTIKNVRRMVSAGYLPIFIDDGGLLDSNGLISDPVNELLRQIEPNDTAYLCLITNRKINKDSIFNIPSLLINPLTDTNTKKLIAKVANTAELQLSPIEISEISDYVNGYPPAAYYAISQCVDYGKDLLLSDKYKLVKFSSQRFLKHLKEVYISKTQKEILTVLASYSPLPLISVVTYCDCDDKEVHQAIYELIDKALVIVDSSALYRIADPIGNAARDLFGFPDSNSLINVLESLKEYSKNLDNRKKLDVSRALYRMAMMTGDSEAQAEGIHLKNDFIQLVQISYHNRNYKEAITFGYNAIKECPENIDAREYLIRALIQQEQWDAAHIQIDELKKYAEIRDVTFLSGFLCRKKGDYSDAVTKFIESENAGRRGAAIKREIAHCYLLMNDTDGAVRYISDAIQLQPDNSHVIDLAVKIYLKAGMKNEAENALGRLELIDKTEYFLLRQSQFEYRFGKYPESETTALRAKEEGGKYFFSGGIQLARCYIKNHKFDLARNELNSLDSIFSGQKKDVRVALRCRLLLGENKYQDTLQCVESFKDKSCFQFGLLKTLALEGVVENTSISYKKRQEYKRELELIKPDNSAGTDILDEIEI